MNHFKNPKFYRATNGDVYESYDGTPWQPDHVAITRKEGEAAQKAEAIKFLKKTLKPGATVYTILNHCSTSGMSRCISLAYGQKNGEILKLDFWVSRAFGERIDNKHGGLKVVGCGMDMGFHLVYRLGRVMWPKGTAKPHGSRNGTPDMDGGYALKQTWL